MFRKLHFLVFLSMLLLLEAANSSSQADLKSCFRGEWAPEILIEKCTIVLKQHKKDVPKETVYKVHAVLAMSYAEVGQLALSTESYTKAISINPDFLEGYFLRATNYIKMGRYEHSIRDFNHILSISTEKSEINKKIIFHSLMGRGSSYSVKGCCEEAVRDFDEAIKMNPKNSQAYRGRGLAIISKGNFNEGLRDIEKAISLDPGDTLSFAARGSLYVEMKLLG